MEIYINLIREQMPGKNVLKAKIKESEDRSREPEVIYWLDK